MPGMNGLDVARRLAERGDDVKVVMLSAREDRDALFSAISAGARGYVAKDAEPDQLFAAIDLVLRGGTVLSTGVAQNLGEGIRQLDYAPGAYEQRRLALTDRELEILRLLATPKSPAQMASQLFLEQEDGAEPHLGDLPQARRAQPLRGHRQGHGAAPHRQQGLRGRARLSGARRLPSPRIRHPVRDRLPARRSSVSPSRDAQWYEPPGRASFKIREHDPMARGKAYDDDVGEGRDPPDRAETRTGVRQGSHIPIRRDLLEAAHKEARPVTSHTLIALPGL